MDRTIQKLTLLLCFFLLLSGFTATGFYPYHAKAFDSDSLLYQPRKEKLSTFERSFTPSFYDTEVYLYKKNDSSKTQGRPIDNFTSAPPETVQGYRVQLIATSDYDQAMNLRNELNIKYPELWVYTIYEAPMYKVRAGDFTNRAEAKNFLDKIQSEGYRTAWIVPDRIIRNQPPKPPLPVQIDSIAVHKNFEE